MNFEDCTGELVWAQLLYVRRIRSRQCWAIMEPSSSHMPMPWSIAWVIAWKAIKCVFAAIPLAIFASVCLFTINGVSGGELLTIIGSHFPGPQLAGSFDRMDKHLCGAVVAGGTPCVIFSNPDVAGIGVSCFLTFLLCLVIQLSNLIRVNFLSTHRLLYSLPL
jgi:hypothetical protein